jgi:hypothetical protein
MGMAARAESRQQIHVSYFFILEFTKRKAQMNDLLAAVYLIFFAAIAGGAFALMTQNLRSSQGRDAAQSPRKRSSVHPEAPQPGEEVMYADFSRERLERMYQQTP